MENKSMRPSLEDCRNIIKLYAPIMAIPFDTAGYSELQSGKIRTIETESKFGWIVTGFKMGYSVPWDSTSILVKSLEKISDEDAIDLAKIGDEDTTFDKWALVGIGKTIIKNYFDKNWTPDDCSISLMIAMIDLLRSRGYALPYKNWSVQELVEFGVYKLEE